MQGIDGIREGGANRLIKHGEERDRHGRSEGDGEGVDPQAGAEGKGFEPPGHAEKRQRRRDEESDHDELQEIPREQRDDSRNAGPEHFPDAYFFDALLGRVSSEPEQAETRNKNGDEGEKGEGTPPGRAEDPGQ